MREALVIFRKDVRRLWPLGVAVSAVVVFHGWIDLRPLNIRLYGYEPWVLFLAWWCLVGVLVQQERTVGDRQYWLTRPISRRAVIGAKALFLVSFICAPNFVAQIAVLTLTGFSVADYFGSLVWNQLMLFSFFAVAAAVAAITRNFREYAGTSLALIAGFLFFAAWAAETGSDRWGGFQWVQESVSQLVIFAVSAAVLAIQYRSHRTALARLIEGAGIVLTLLFVWTGSWHQAFAITSALGGAPDEASREVRVVFDPSAPPAVASATTTGARIALPVRVTGIPHGRELLSERASATIQAPGVATWNSGWQEKNQLASRTIWKDSADWLAEDGPYWLTFDVPASYLASVKDRPTRLRITIALAEFTAPAITKLPANQRQYPVPGVGHCSLDTMPYTGVSCVAPFGRRNAVVDFHIQSHTAGNSWSSSWRAVWYAPFGTLGSFSAWTEVGGMPVGFSLDDEVSVSMRRPVSFFERQIAIADIQLAPYEVAR